MGAFDSTLRQQRGFRVYFSALAAAITVRRSTSRRQTAMRRHARRMHGLRVVCWSGPSRPVRCVTARADQPARRVHRSPARARHECRRRDQSQRRRVRDAAPRRPRRAEPAAPRPGGVAAGEAVAAVDTAAPREFVGAAARGRHAHRGGWDALGARPGGKRWNLDGAPAELVGWWAREDR